MMRFPRGRNADWRPYTPRILGQADALSDGGYGYPAEAELTKKGTRTSTFALSASVDT